MISYKESGVDLLQANLLGDFLKNSLSEENADSFASVYENPLIKDYYLVACTDGIGSKIIPLLERNDLKTIANDLIAMTLNDLICTGAKPLFFLDYISVNKLDAKLCENFLGILKEELKKYCCPLVGGETSELNSIIKEKCFDVAGFMVGIVNKKDYLNKANVKPDDVIIGLKSSGVHSNGFSLIRKLYEEKLLSDEDFNTTLCSTKIYADLLFKLNELKLIKTAANITGNGLFHNVKRAVPKELDVKINKEEINSQPIFEKLKSIIGEEEAFRTFNMGVGFCLIVDKENCDKVLELSKEFAPKIIGKVVKR